MSSQVQHVASDHVDPTPTPSPSGRTMPGDSSKFKLLAELGRGGMATVYLAVVRGPAGFNKLVVVKCLRPSLAAEAEFLEMFLAEARLAARINHPNVVQTNEVGFDGHFYYIVMEYIEGPTLESIVRKAGETLPVNLHLFVLMQALEGLHHAHELKDFDGKPVNVVHRDVSPHNIMVSYDGQVKLLDFGIAKAADSGGNTRTGIMKGKCAYMAAEQFGGQQVDRRADIFAAGVCLWQAITNARLWKGLSDAEIFSRLSRGEIPSPKTIRPDLPDGLVKITMRSLGLRPEDRFSTVQDFLGALDEFISQHPEYRASQRDLARFVNELFGKERAQMQSKIDEQLRAVAQIGTGLVAFQTETPQSLVGMTPVPATVNRASGGGGFMKLAIAGIVLVAAVAAGGVVLLKRATPTKVAGGGEAALAQVKVNIKAVPETAKIFWDDAPLTGNPATADFTRDGLSHRVRAEAPGYLRKTELVVLDSSNVSVEMELEKESGDEVDPFGNKLTSITIKSPAPNARLYIDGILLPNNPNVGKYTRDGKPHEVKADAPGYIAKTQKITFDKQSDTVNLELARDPKAPAVAAAPPPHPANHPHRAVDRTLAGGSDPATAPGGGGGGGGAAAKVEPAPKASEPAAAPAKTSGKVIDRGNPWADK